VIRLEPTGEQVVTWGEFVETRLLSEYRNAGVPLVRLRPAMDRLRERVTPHYPLAHAHPFLSVAGRELVMKVQEEVGLERQLRLVVVRNDQVVLSGPAGQFVEAADYGPAEDVVVRLHPVTAIREVIVDPLRQFGEPVVRSVPTAVIGEQVRAGEPIDVVAEFYELSRSQVEAAVRFELIRGEAVAA
jgi:uncharacterized protein (DUF433 family)